MPKERIDNLQIPTSVWGMNGCGEFEGKSQGLSSNAAHDSLFWSFRSTRLDPCTCCRSEPILNSSPCLHSPTSIHPCSSTRRNRSSSPTDLFLKCNNLIFSYILTAILRLLSFAPHPSTTTQQTNLSLRYKKFVFVCESSE